LIPHAALAGAVNRKFKSRPAAEHSIADDRIFAACDKYESPPVFLRSDQSESMPPGVAEKASKWMNAADDISVGSRVQVHEDGNDVCNSESDSDNEDHGTALEDAYKDIPTNDSGDPLGSAHKMSTERLSGLRGLERPPVVERQLKVYPDELVLINILIRGLSKLDLKKWAPQPTAEAPETLAKISDVAAHSRMRPIADGANQSDMHRSSAGTDGAPSQGIPLPWSVQSQAPAQG
jgi:hypothetical protein